MGGLDEFVEISGRIHTSGKRCVLQLPGEAVLIKSPGLGAALMRDAAGIRVTSGSPMIDVACELSGRFVPDAAPGYRRVFGDLRKVVVYSAAGEPIPLDVSKFGTLNPAQIEDCEDFERRYHSTDLRQRYLSERESWLPPALPISAGNTQERGGECGRPSLGRSQLDTHSLITRASP